jgi:prepilin-type N-terminal cleavage/methylation domain-containing protein
VKRIRRTEGFTLIELLLVVVIVGLLAAIAIPGMLRARMSANETSAIGSLRVINTAQQDFAQFCNGYADALPDLGLRPGGQHPYLSPDMTSGAEVGKSGYLTTLVGGMNGDAIADGQTNALCAGVGVTAGYYATAVAVTWGFSGMRAFATDEAGAIFQDSSRNVAPPQPLAPGDGISQIQ